jgi:DNA-binding NarL/FixJ family response regulator
MKCLINLNSDLDVLGAYAFDHPMEGVSGADAHIALVDLTAVDRVEVVADLQLHYPTIRVVVITESGDLECQANALKLGAVGIVHRDQNPKILLEALRQVHRGDTWLNQVLLNRILSNKGSTDRKRLDSLDYCSTDQLTPREREVIRMIGEGLKNRLIAERLFISEATVRHHLSSIYGKVGVEDRLNLVIYAYANGLVSFPGVAASA